jgi:hypothetical protein
LVLREVRDEEAAGSNPVTPTVFPQVKARTRNGAGLSAASTAARYGKYSNDNEI